MSKLLTFNKCFTCILVKLFLFFFDMWNIFEFVLRYLKIDNNYKLLIAFQTYPPVSSLGKTSASTFRQRARSSPYLCKTWTHDFVCLASTNVEETPTSIKLENLRRTGLGWKKIVFKNKMVITIILDKHLNHIFVGKYKLSACVASLVANFSFAATPHMNPHHTVTGTSYKP